LQQTPPREVSASRLACDLLPQLVDGKLETAGALYIEGYVERRNVYDPRLSASQYFVNSTQIIGSQRAEAIIKLDKSTYITDVEVYAESAMNEILLDVAEEEPKPSYPIAFERIKDRQLMAPIQEGQWKRFRVGKKILYLRISARGVEDTARSEKEGRFNQTVSKTPLKGPTVREVKFYEIPTE
jgi:hypothetical protein